MNRFSGPAPRQADAALFKRAGGGLSRLQKKARAELRQGAREKYWALKQLRDQEADDTGER